MHRTDGLLRHALNNATAKGDMGRNSTGVKAWFAFCEAERLSPYRALDPNVSLADKLLEEQLCMCFVIAIIQDRGVAPATVANYFSQVQGWHHREEGIKLCAGLSLGRLPQMLKGLRRVIGESPRAVRRGIAPQALRRAFDLVLDKDNPLHANIRAALAVALQGLYCAPSNSAWTAAKQSTSKSTCHERMFEC